jgi:hypothetical protein
MREFTPAPKPGPKRKGRAVRRNKEVAEAARRRDGACLYGILYRDGCVPGYAPHHITSFGSDPTQDVLENLICLCQKHHDMAGAREIPDITLRGILYHFYGYGPKEEVVAVLDDMKKSAGEYGLTSIFELEPRKLIFKAVGFVSRFSREYSWTEVMSGGFLQIFDADLADSQRVVGYE